MALTCAVSCPSPVSESLPPTASARFAPEVCVLFLLVRQDCLHLLVPVLCPLFAVRLSSSVCSLLFALSNLSLHRQDSFF